MRVARPMRLPLAVCPVLLAAPAAAQWRFKGDDRVEADPVGLATPEAGVPCRVHAAFGAPDQTAEIAFYTRRLDTVRCALR